MSYFNADIATHELLTSNIFNVTGNINVGQYNTVLPTLTNNSNALISLDIKGRAEANVEGEVSITNQISGFSLETTHDLINGNIGVLKDDISLIKVDIDYSNININFINTIFGSISTSVDSISTDITNSNTYLNNIDTNFATIKDDIKLIQTDINFSNTSLTNIDTDLDTINTKLTAINTDAAFSNLTLIDIDTNIDSINTDVINIESNVKLINSNIGSIKININSIENTVSTNNAAPNSSDVIIIGGVHETTLTKVSDGEVSTFKTSNEGILMTVPRCTSVTLPASVANTNRYLPKSCDGNYITNINFPYQYNKATGQWNRYTQDIIRDYRKNGDVYEAVIWNRTDNNSLNQLVLHNNGTSDIYIYYIESQCNAINNISSGNFIFTRILTFAGSSSLVGGSDYELSTVNLNDITQSDSYIVGGNSFSGSSSTLGGTLLGAWMSLGTGRVNEDNDTSKEFIKLTQNQGIILRAGENASNDNIVGEIRIKYIRTTDTL